ncbi:MAG: hypothetical protein SVM80_12510, partial [Halobacteriota archaeon]|nr:hypothetical protein [Halobacteriota archaeon]
LHFEFWHVISILLLGLAIFITIEKWMLDYINYAVYLRTVPAFTHIMAREANSAIISVSIGTFLEIIIQFVYWKKFY